MLGALRGSIRPCRLSGLEDSTPATLLLHKRPAKMAKLATILAVAAPEAPTGTKHLKVHTVSTMNKEDVKKCIARPRVDFQSILQTVRLSRI